MAEVKINDRSAIVIGQITRAVEAAITDEAEAVLADIRSMFRAPKHGEFYGAHQASAAGEPPAIDEGTLDESMVIDREGPFAASVHPTGKGEDEMIRLESGTRKMAPRPTIDPATELSKPRFRKRVDAAIGKALGGR